VDVGIGAGAGTTVPAAARGTDRTQADVQRAVTEHILAIAGRPGRSAALVNAVGTGSWPGETPVISWPQLARMVRTAAAGLSRRGVRAGDTAAIFVADAASHAVAVHALRTAGAIAVPVRSAPAAADIAAQLRACQARVLITSAELAGLATEAVERSWVRQVFCFGEAEGTTPFGDLLGAGRPDRGPADREGPGEPAVSREVIVSAPPCGDPVSYTALLDEALAAGATVVAAPLDQLEFAVRTYQAAAAITPAGRWNGADTTRP
jgi:AMP-binding enzyme